MTKEKEQQMEQLFHDNYERMYRLAFALLHDNEEARDVVSDVFSRLWDRFSGDYGDKLSGDKPPAYLLKSVKNACLNIIAKKKRDERLAKLLPISDEAETPGTSKVIAEASMQAMNENATRLEERWQATLDCIEHDLTPQTASVIRMCYGDGCSYRETAEELGISISAVNKHIVKGLRTLREKLKGF